MRGSASAQVVVPFQYGGQRNTFPGLGQIEGVPGVRKNFDPEGRSALRISGRVRSQFLLQIGRGGRGWAGCIWEGKRVKLPARVPRSIRGRQ